jgi:hypothetical protein
MQSPTLSKDSALHAVPILNGDIRLQTSPQGFVRIRYPIQLKPWLTRLLPENIPLPMRTLELDSMGSFVWNHIDGRNSVQNLAEIVTNHYKCHPSEAEQAVATFIRQLGRRGIIGLH